FRLTHIQAHPVSSGPTNGDSGHSSVPLMREVATTSPITSQQLRQRSRLRNDRASTDRSCATYATNTLSYLRTLNLSGRSSILPSRLCRLHRIHSKTRTAHLLARSALVCRSRIRLIRLRWGTRL